MSIDLQSTATAVATEDARRTFRSIEAGRGVAAVLVVLYHADRLVPNPAYWGARAFHGAFVGGHAGVEFFFVLSGFIIAHVHARDIGRRERLGRYLARRFDRVYPLYWLILTVVVGLALVGPSFGSLAHVRPAAIVGSYLLAGIASHDGVLTVSWTLFHEILFYAAFAAAIIDRRAGVAVAVAWFGLIAEAGIIGGGGLPDYVTSPLNLLFGLGVATRTLVGRRDLRRPLGWAAAGIGAAIALGLEEAFAPVLGETARNLLYGLASAVALAGFVAYERRRPLAVPRALSLLGAASYSIYLTHYPALSLVARIAARLGLTAAPPEVGFAILTLAVVGLGVAMHYAVERPLLERLRNIRSTRADTAALFGAYPARR